MTRKKKRGFYERLKTHVKQIGGRVELTIIFPQSAGCNLFPEIKSSVRRRRTRKQATPEREKPAA